MGKYWFDYVIIIIKNYNTVRGGLAVAR